MEIPAFSCETWRLDAEFWALQIMFSTTVNCRLSPVDYTEQTFAAVNKYLAVVIQQTTDQI